MKNLEDLYDDLLENHVELFKVDFDLPAEADGVIMKCSGRYGIFLNRAKIRTRAQEKVAVAHEMAHFYYEEFYSPRADQSVVRRAETKADRMTVEILLPFADLKRAIFAGYTTPWDLAEELGVTEEFVRQAYDYYTVCRGYRLD